MKSIGTLELSVIVAVALLLFGGKGIAWAATVTRGGRRAPGSGRYLLLFLYGSGASFVYGPLRLLLQGNSPLRAFEEVSAEHALQEMLQNGAIWLLLGALLRWFRRIHPIPLWQAVAGMWLVEPVISLLVFYLVLGRMSEFSWLSLLSGEDWLRRLSAYPGTVIDGLNALVLVLVSNGSGNSLSLPSQVNEYSSSYGEIPMTNSMSQTTRFLAAAAFQNSAGLRGWLLHWVKDSNRAVAPELGVDLALVARVAQFAENRERKYTFLFLVLDFLALILLAAELPAGAVLVAIGATVLWFKKDAEQRGALMGNFNRQNYSAERIEQKFTAPLTDAHPAVMPEDDSNLTVYSGFSPFVGAGIDLGGWSFAVAIDKAKAGEGSKVAPTPFQLPELYSTVSRAVDRLQLAGMEQRDHFFAHGCDVRGDAELLPYAYGRPVQMLNPAVVDKYLHSCDSRVRHYKWFQVRDWGGDIVFSYFLRCSLRGPTLFVEIKRYLLTPLRASIRDVDTLAPRSFGAEMMHLFVVAPIAGVANLIAAPFSVLGYFNHGLEKALGGAERKRRKLIDTTPLFDYGTATSVRQQFASNEYMRYFQRADSDYYQKTLEKEILDALIEFLDSRGIDTSDLRERQSTILNNGVIVQGGNIEAGSLSVGEGARAIQKVKNVVGKAKGMSAGGGA